MATVNVEIAGRTYTLQAEGAREEDVVRAAAMVDSRMQEIARALPQAGVERIAILALVHMADELIQTQREIERFDTFIDAQTRRIEAAVAE
ncbi:MAG: cell division protein ZapA [Nitrospirae bacterium]|nr:MAG: cell division protein ZapA [Nitrospirota bacterium]